MEEARADNDDDDIFVYMGGDQQVPDGVRRARIHKSVKIVPRGAFYRHRQLISVEFHDGIDIIEEEAFCNCRSLSGTIKLPSVRRIGYRAFSLGIRLTDVEFGDKLETIERHAFYNCDALKSVKMPYVRTIGRSAFCHCHQLSDVDCSESLCLLQDSAFSNCHDLERIALPLKSITIEDNVFLGCQKLTLDLGREIRQTVASLHMESWRNEMNNEINRINEELSTLGAMTESAIQQWLESISDRLDRYKTEHLNLLKEATTLLELALWKANLGEREEEEDRSVGEPIKKAKIDSESTRKERRITCGADTVIKNVFPFLQLE